MEAQAGWHSHPVARDPEPREIAGRREQGKPFAAFAQVRHRLEQFDSGGQGWTRAAGRLLFRIKISCSGLALFVSVPALGSRCSSGSTQVHEHV